MTGMKYVVYKDATFAMFPVTIQHKELRLMGKTIVGAGFVDFQKENEFFVCYGESESLGIKSRGEEDGDVLDEGFIISKCSKRHS